MSAGLAGALAPPGLPGVAAWSGVATMAVRMQLRVGMGAGAARSAALACPPSALPRALRWPDASEQPNPPPAAGKGALNVDFRAGGGDERRVRISVFVFAPLARTIGASDQEEASCLRDREKQSVCKMDRRLAGGDGYGWLWGRRECLRRMRRAPIRKSFSRRGCRFRLSRPLRSRACRSLRFRLRADRCSAGRPTPAVATAGRREHELRRREHRRQRRRLQLDDGAELGFVCGQCGGRDGRERDGARGDLCDGVELSERGVVRGEQCDRRVPDDQLDLQRGYQGRGGVRS